VKRQRNGANTEIEFESPTPGPESLRIQPIPESMLGFVTEVTMASEDAAASATAACPQTLFCASTPNALSRVICDLLNLV
jgi:hypothetical protein